MNVVPLGDSAVVLTLGTTIDRETAARVRAVATELRRLPPAGAVDIVPAFASVAIFFEPGRLPDERALEGQIADALTRVTNHTGEEESPVVEVPVCYGGAHGPDLEAVARRAGLTPAEVMARHAGAEYLVHAVGFAPGFPYLGGLPSELATPRRETPRPRVAAGSVGIGGAQTGVYPLESPGGWNLIGRTNCRLFDARRTPPGLLQAGDRLKFRAVPELDFSAPSPAVTEPGEDANGVEVLRAGMHTTVQDLGRFGWRADGVPVSGATDPFALRVANLLVGNPEGAAALELSLVGPDLRFRRDALVALGGAEFDGLIPWRPVRVTAGTILQLGAARSGCRGYLAVAGGIQVEPVLGSRSTLVRAGLGGWGGRALRAGDVLPLPECGRELRGSWRVDPRLLPAYSSAPCVRVLAGAQAGEFPRSWLETSFTVGRESDRMGLRLGGARIARAPAGELLSSPVAPGTIQVPPDGQPIVLLADAGTIGGYPQIAHVAAVDLPLVAQLRPGDTVRFREVPLGEARALAEAREHSLALLRAGLKEKWA